jgi:hypothetical protein
VQATGCRQQQPFPSSALRIGHDSSSALHLASVAAFADSRAVYCGWDGTALAADVIAHPGVIKSTAALRSAREGVGEGERASSLIRQFRSFAFELNHCVSLRERAE